MMGHTHAISGAAAWLAAAPLLPTLSPLDSSVAALACAGASLLPDLDHPRATLARSIPLAGGVAAGVVGALAGGHRQGLHSILAVAGCGLGTWLLSPLVVPLPGELFAIPAGPALLLLGMLAFAARSLRMARSWWTAWLLGLLLAAAASWLLPGLAAWLPFAITIGYAAHIAGDALTVGGVPLLWPLPTRIAMPVLGRTGSLREAGLAVALSVYVLVALALLWWPTAEPLLGPLVP